MNSCDALVQISDHVLNSLESLHKLEYNRNGRKYKFINNGFQRIKQEDKHLVINVADLSMNSSTISAYSILHSIDDGELLEAQPDFCLSIIGVARQLEQNKWFENSNVIHYSRSTIFDPQAVQNALDFSQKITPKHLHMGMNLLICSKLNFFHTDHHLGVKLYGYYLVEYMKEYFGEEVLNDPKILIALKSFVHWGNIKCVLYKLDIPNVYVSPEEQEIFAKFPVPNDDLKEEVWSKYPSGTSRYSLLRRTFDLLADWDFAKLIEYPKGDTFDLFWLYDLCHEIDRNPIRYHLRSAQKNLCLDPINLNELANTHSKNIKSLLDFVSIMLNVFHLDYEFLVNNSKIPKFDEKFTKAYSHIIHPYTEIWEKIDNYQSKGWNTDDIVLRLQGSVQNSVFDKVMEMRNKFIDDYE